MIRLFIIFTLAIILQSGYAIAQSTTSASPSPTPVKKSPMLDQFGLSTGVFANTGSTASTAKCGTRNESRVRRPTYLRDHHCAH